MTDTAAETNTQASQTDWQNLLRDRGFGRGFHNPLYCDSEPGAYSGDTDGQPLRRGRCLRLSPDTPSSYRTVPYRERLRPGREPYWKLNEGIRTHPNGDLIHYHYLANNRNVFFNDGAGRFLMQQCYLGKSSCGVDELVKSIDVEAGRFRAYWNTSLEPNNIATGYATEYANNTWPTLYIEQDFEELIDLADFAEMRLRFSGRVNSAVNITGPGVPAEANFVAHFLLRSKRNPFVAMFIGANLYSSIPARDVFNVEQFGQVFFLDAGVDGRFGGRWEENVERAFSLPLKQQVAEAIRRSVQTGLGRALHPNPDDYWVAGIAIGWENTRNWTVGYEVGDIRVEGLPVASATSVSWSPETAGYLVNNPDLAEFFRQTPSGVPFGQRADAHYRNSGFAEGRRACTFNAAHYLRVNGDLAAAGVGGPGGATAQEHYSLYGAQEGRAACCFSEREYLRAHPWVANAIRSGAYTGTAYEHYRDYGINEGLQGCCTGRSCSAL